MNGFIFNIFYKTINELKYYITFYNKYNNMDLSKIKQFDDDTLFRFFSKSYSKNKSSFTLNPLQSTVNSIKPFKRNSIDIKARSQSSSFCNALSKSVNIT